MAYDLLKVVKSNFRANGGSIPSGATKLFPFCCSFLFGLLGFNGRGLVLAFVANGHDVGGGGKVGE